MYHAEVKRALARAVADDTRVRDFCIEHFGRGALVIVDWYGAEGAPGENEAPYIFIYSTGENSGGAVDEKTLDIMIECGGICSNIPSRERVVERTATANGLAINGCAFELEQLREIVIDIARGVDVGMAYRSVSYTESSTASFPLEWAESRLTYFVPNDISL